MTPSTNLYLTSRWSRRGKRADLSGFTEGRDDEDQRVKWEATAWTSAEVVDLLAPLLLHEQVRRPDKKWHGLTAADFKMTVNISRDPALEHMT